MRFFPYTLFLFFLSLKLTGAAIVFDLNGVLLNVSHSSCLRMIPLTSLVNYITFDAPSLRSIKLDWFKFLTLLEHQPSLCATYDPSGEKVPDIMENNLRGTLTCNDVCNRAEQATIGNNHYFKSAAHRSFMLALTKATFKPDLFVNSLYWFNDMLDLAIEYKRQGHTVFILSNLNDEHFYALKARYPLHLDFFDGVVISGCIHLVKPEPAIYTYLLETYNLDPSQTLFIDDQPTNCAGAEACGITSILCPQKQSWKNLWSKEPDADEVRRLINLRLYRMEQATS